MTAVYRGKISSIVNFKKKVAARETELRNGTVTASKRKENRKTSTRINMTNRTKFFPLPCVVQTPTWASLAIISFSFCLFVPATAVLTDGGLAARDWN